MSVHVSSWVFRHSPAEKSDRLVLLVLADHANGDGHGARPAVTTIQREARLRGRSTVQGCLRVLQRAGAIEPTGAHDDGCIIYRVSMDLAEQDWSGIYAEWEDPLEKHRRRRGGGAQILGPTQGTENSSSGAQKTDGRGTESGPKPTDKPSNEPTPPAPKGEKPAKWLAVVEDLRAKHVDTPIELYLEPLEVVESSPQRLVLTGPDFAIEWVRVRWVDEIQEAAWANGLLNHDGTVLFAETSLERRRREQEERRERRGNRQRRAS